MSELDDIRKRAEGLRDLADMPISMLGITGDTKAQMGADIADAALRIATEQKAELTQLRTERDRLRSVVTKCVHMAADRASENEGFAPTTLDEFIMVDGIAALTQREPRGQQIWPPVVDSATDSREGGTDADDR